MIFLKIFASLSTLFALLIPIHNRIIGEYVDSLGNRILVMDDQLVYIRHNGPFLFDTLAVCELKHIHNQFYSISSKVTDSLLSSKKIYYSNDSTYSDSLSFVLDIPFTHSELSVDVSISDIYSYELLAKKSFLFPNKKVCTLPMEMGKDLLLSLSITPLNPQEYEPFDIHWANYLGIIHYWDFISIPTNINNIIYSNQGFDDRVFKRLSIQDEIIIINSSSIKWRDITFNKKK